MCAFVFTINSNLHEEISFLGIAAKAMHDDEEYFYI